MFKSKHSGWTWDLKRTPFGGGGGGGIGDIVSSVTDPISSALGTDGSGGGALGALASIDPGPAIGSGLAQVDQAVNNTIPGGWITVAGLAAGGAALAFAPEVMALAATEGITPEAAALATGTMPVDVATGATVSPDVFAGLSASAPVDTAASQAAAASLAPAITSNPVTPAMVAAANASSDPIGMMGYLTSATPEELAAATGAGAQTPTSLAEALKTANQVRQVASTANTLSQLLTQGSTGGAAGSALAGAAQNLATGQTGVGMAIPALVRGNQNPFLQSAQQPIRSSSPDLASLAQLLKQG
jgi:hypothetical protein